MNPMNLKSTQIPTFAIHKSSNNSSKMNQNSSQNLQNTINKGTKRLTVLPNKHVKPASNFEKNKIVASNFMRTVSLNFK